MNPEPLKQTSESRIQCLEERIFNSQGTTLNHTLDQSKLSKKNPFGAEVNAEKDKVASFKFVSVSCTDLNYITTIDPKQTKKPNH